MHVHSARRTCVEERRVAIMTEVGWPSVDPKEAGWYWWKSDESSTTYQVLQVWEDLSVHGINNEADHVDECGGIWLGPITPDSYQQALVVGLRDALDVAWEQHMHPSECCDCRGEIICAIEMRIKSAQQAQGGNGR